MKKNLTKIVLDLGCGLEKLKAQKNEKVIGVDYIKTKAVDKIHNLESPLPFPDNFADRIYSNHTFEHIANAKSLIEECWRITKAKAEIFIRVPHYSHNSMYTDLTHKTFFSSRSLDYYIDGNELEKMSGYNPKVRFKMIKKKIVFDLPYKILEPIVNINDKTRKAYEWFFCWIFPAREIEFKLSPTK